MCPVRVAKTYLDVSMNESEFSQEERILKMIKRVLTDIAKETHARPGFRHPLSDHTILGMRECLALIAARERQLAEAAGRPMTARPRFIDEPLESVVVKLDTQAVKRDPQRKDDNCS
jgi:hypothetical protein